MKAIVGNKAVFAPSKGDTSITIEGGRAITLKDYTGSVRVMLSPDDVMRLVSLLSDIRQLAYTKGVRVAGMQVGYDHDSLYVDEYGEPTYGSLLLSTPNVGGGVMPGDCVPGPSAYLDVEDIEHVIDALTA